MKKNINQKNDKKIINVTPDPRILEVIAAASIHPVQALCELIDNSIDGFAKAKKEGARIENPTIYITLPRNTDIENGIGKLVVEDNGPGMSLEEAGKAVTAGYSGQRNPLDTLGLYGVGFNIATAKLGKVTKLKSSKIGDGSWAEITI